MITVMKEQNDMLQEMETDNLFLKCSPGNPMSPAVNNSQAFELNIHFLRQNKAS